MIWLETIANGILLGGLMRWSGFGLGFAQPSASCASSTSPRAISSSRRRSSSYLYPWTPLHPFSSSFAVALIAFGIGILLQRVLINRVLGHDQIRRFC